MITNILHRETLQRGEPLDILWTPCDDSYFEKFITKLGHRIFSMDDLYFAQCAPHLIVCNNKITIYEKVSQLSIFLHCPVLIIDHQPKTHIIDEEKIQEINRHFPCCATIAISENVYNSWKQKHAHTLHYDIKDDHNHELWNNILYTTAKMVFKYDHQ